MADGGYDDGYEVCECFWGNEPSGLVSTALDLLDRDGDQKALDLGCGEGKNSKLLSAAGYTVLSVDISEKALSNAAKSNSHAGITYLQADLTTISGPANQFDLVIATGSLHCLQSEMAIKKVIASAKFMTKPNGINVITGFDDGDHDMSGHAPSFRPTLLAHDQYLDLYRDWEIVHSSSLIQDDCHPNNGIMHSHSITRLLVRNKSRSKA